MLPFVLQTSIDTTIESSPGLVFQIHSFFWFLCARAVEVYLWGIIDAVAILVCKFKVEASNKEGGDDILFHFGKLDKH